MSEPLISVIMAAFNVGDMAFLDRAIMSILEQDMGDWELVICDDGSTDGTYQRLLEWEKKDRRILVLRNEQNRKAAFARNRCVEKARGAYIAVMDADDLSGPNRLSAQAAFLSAHPQYSFVGTRGECFTNEPGDTQKTYWFCEFPQAKDFLMTLPFVHASLMFRRESLLAVGGYEETARVERSEDYDMLMRLYEKGARGANIADTVYYIREDEGTYRRRKYRYRLKEAAVKFRGFARLGLMPAGVLYAVKPLIVGLIPVSLLEKLKGRYYGRKMSSEELGRHG